MALTAVVILAGGKSKRMGRDKLALSVNGRTLLESAVSRFKEKFDDVYISVADAEKYPEIKAGRIVDILPGAGPLSGLHAALAELSCDGVFLVAADLPFASPHTAGRVIKLCRNSEASVIRLPDGKLEPLFGYYKKTLLSRCEVAIASGDYRMTELLYKADTRFISPNELGDLWSETMIININSPEDFKKVTLEFT